MKHLKAITRVAIGFVFGGACLFVPSLEAETASSVAAGQSKVLHFPTDRCMGGLSIEDPCLGSEYLEVGRDLSLPLGLDPKRMALAGNWDFVGRALGDMSVPAGRKVQLVVILSPGKVDPRRLPELVRYYLKDRVMIGPEDLSGLSGLAPDDLYKLSVEALVRRSDADERILKPILRLTGLRILTLGQTGVTYKGLELLKSLPSLRALEFRQERIGVRGMAVLKDLPALEYLDCDVGATDAGLKHLGQCPHLRWLSIRMGTIWGPGLAELANLPRLERLALCGGTRVTDRHIRCLEGLTHLKSLTLWSAADHLTDASLASIGKLTSLEELYFIRTSPQFTGAGMAHLKSLRNLRRVDFGQAMVGDEGVGHLAELPRLESIGGGLRVTAEGMKTLGAMSRLKRLYVGLKEPLQGYHGPTGVPHLRHLTSLEELALDGRLTDEDLRHVEPLTRLKCFRTQGRGITDRGVASITKLKALQHLHLSTTGMTKRGLNALSGLTNLRCLSVDVHYAIESGVDETPLNLTALTGLDTLTLVGFALGDPDLASVAGMRRLEWLRLQSDSLTDEGLTHLSDLAQLQTLSVSGLSCSTGQGLAHLSGLKSLRDMRLEGRITDASLAYLGDLPAVWSLWIVTDEVIRPETAAGITQRLPALEHIHVVEPPRFDKPPIQIRGTRQRTTPRAPRAKRRRR